MPVCYRAALRVVSLSLGLVVACASAFAADVDLLDRLPSGHDFVVRLDLERLAAKGGLPGLSELVDGDLDRGLVAALTAFEDAGFDPRRDLRELVISGPADVDGADGLVVLARGTYDREALAANLEARGAAKKAVGGRDVFVAPDAGGKPTAVTFLDDDTIALVRDSQLPSLLAVDPTAGAALSGHPEFGEALRAVDTGAALWGIVRGDAVQSAISESTSMPVPTGGLTWMSFDLSMSESADVSISAGTESAGDATRIAQAMAIWQQLGVGLVRAQDPVLADALSTLKVAAADDRLDLKLTLDADTLEHLRTRASEYGR